MEPTAIQTLLTSFTDVFTWVLTQLGSIMTFVLGQPIIIVFIAIPLVGVIIGFVTRLVHLQKGAKKR